LVADFLLGIWRSGGLVGRTADEAFFVKCGRDTMTQADIDAGRLICLVGVAPMKPAEFVVFRISQMTREAQALI
jgi:phage tail sheath protein FI